ncbi:MAG: MazG nucleotide pyrophosphohydrolase domain-containing protein [Asgard group archaeon]|nr:MazG nucleotide pyrophosphohydrolase domain-containing protein [Asgard group archaeon]
MTDIESLFKKIDKLISSLGGYWSEEWLIYPVIEELGEFSKELQIVHKLHPKRESNHQKLQEEFGDLVFAVFALGRGLNIDIKQALINTIKKYERR